MLFEALVVSVIIGFLRGGSLRKLEKLNFRLPELVIVAFLIQFSLPIVAKYFNFSRLIGLSVILFSYILLFVAVAFNWKNLYFKIMGIGIFLNFLVILLNKGMPVSLEFLHRFASPEAVASVKNMRNFLHVPLTSKTYFWFLADILPLPKPYPFPSIFSVGDVILTVGAFLLVQDTMVYLGKRARKRSFLPFDHSKDKS